jgi:CDP-2,3-bis-(O-geranylgeranyl)-sn-glycerol synthase
MHLLESLLRAQWFLLPAGAANMAPVFAQKLLPSWNAPVDFHCTFRGKRLFGEHKTWRGMAAGVAAGTLTFLLQRALFISFAAIRDLSVFDYTRHSVLLGAWLGLGALAGDLVKSAAKRQRNIPPGRPWIPFDQIDWLGGMLVFAWIALPLPPMLFVGALAVGLVLHIFVNAVGHAVRLRRTWI